MATETAIDWRALIRAEAAAAPNGRGFAHVAELIGVKRAYVSRAMSEGSSGLGDAVSDRFIKRVYDALLVVRECPATGQRTPRTECQRIGNGDAPTHNPLQMQVWRVCQGCAFKPAKEVI